MSESDLSESTIEPFQIESVLDALDRGAKDAIESKDYLTYSTLLDIYLGDPSKYSLADREVLLSHLLKLLKSHPELTYEISWDLPSLIILYVESDFDFHGALREAPSIYKVLKLFEVLALEGNPKELFLKSCELLTSLRVGVLGASLPESFEPVVEEEEEEEEDEEEDEEDKKDTATKTKDSGSEIGPTDVSATTITPKDPDYDQVEIDEKYFEIKIYCIFELVDSCLKRIKTVYPSRFLSMTVTSVLNLAYSNRDYAIVDFLIKRVYSFARNYTSPQLPDTTEFTAEELAKIKEDEDYLQRKLLTGFLTNIFYQTTTNLFIGYTQFHFNFLNAEKNGTKNPDLHANFPASAMMSAPIADRLVELSLSLDVDPHGVFKKFVADSHALFDSFDYTKDEDELSAEIFEKVVIDYQQTLGGSIVDSDAKTINDSTQGVLLLFTQLIAGEKRFDIPVTFKDALVLALRLLIPGLINPKFYARSTLDLSLFWLWYAVYQSKQNKKRIEVEVSSVPKILLTIYYQAIFNATQDYYYKYMSLTTLTKVLTISPEEIGYNFLIDSFHNCPYDKRKASLVGILKELLTKRKEAVSEDHLVDSLTKVSIDKSTIPPLPTREPVSTSPTYFTLTESKVDDIFKLVEKSNEETFTSANGARSVVPIKLSTLTAYLNLLVVLKGSPLVIDRKKDLDKILDLVKENIVQIKSKYGKDETGSLELNAAGILEIALDRIAA